MQENMSLSQLVKAVPGLTHHKYRQLEKQLVLNPPRNQAGHRVFDAFWVKYLAGWLEALERVDCTLDELFSWIENRPDAEQVKRAIPTNEYGLIYLNRDWIRYFESVRDHLAAGRRWEWVVQEMLTPNQVRPQYAGAGVGPEY